MLDTGVEASREGPTPEEIEGQYPSLDLPHVYAAVSYYLHHRRELEEYLGERARDREEVRREVDPLRSDRDPRPPSGPGAELKAMLRFAAAENFNNDILRGLRSRDDLIDGTSSLPGSVDGRSDTRRVPKRHRPTPAPPTPAPGISTAPGLPTTGS